MSLETGHMTGTVRVGKRTYAVALGWNSASRAGTAAKEARSEAAQSGIDADFFCVRTGQTSQYGHGWKSYGHKVGQPALAAHLADSVDGSWIGAFEVEDGYYVVAINEDAVLAESDRFFESRDEAYTAFADLFYVGEWPKAYAPKSWEVENASEVDLEDLLDGKPKTKLVEVNRTKNLIKLAVVAAVGTAAVVGGWQAIQSYRADLERQQRQEAREKALEKGGVTRERIERPWENRAPGNEVLAACLEKMGRLPIEYAGWEVQRVSCSRDRLQASVATSAPVEGTPLWLKRGVEQSGVEGAQVSFGDSQASITAPLGKKFDNIGQLKGSKLMPMRVVRNRLRMNLAEMYVDISYGDGNGNEAADATEFEISADRKPMFMVDVLDAIPAAVLDAVEWQSQDGSWVVRGQFYEDKGQVTRR